MMCFKPLKAKSARCLRALIETFAEHRQALQVCRAPVQHWDTLLVYELSQRLNHESREAWELHNPGNAFQTYQEMRDFITNRSRALEPSSSEEFQIAIPERENTGSNPSEW